MKILVVSDLHLEFQRDGGGALVADFEKDVDVLVAAGDIAVGSGISGALKLLSKHFSHVVYLAGNHEYYGYTRGRVNAIIAEACYEGVHWLYPGHPVTIDDQRFIGGTLWFPRHPTAPKHALHDFKLIKDFESWVYDENRETVHFLEQEVRQTDVVVTHHLPSQMSVAPEYKGSSLNPFFVCDVEHVIRKNKPKLWIHGHTHTSCDYYIDHPCRTGEGLTRDPTTRVVCNPFGYARHEENPKFNPKLVIEIP